MNLNTDDLSGEAPVALSVPADNLKVDVARLAAMVVESGESKRATGGSTAELIADWVAAALSAGVERATGVAAGRPGAVQVVAQRWWAKRSPSSAGARGRPGCNWTGRSWSFSGRSIRTG